MDAERAASPVISPWLTVSQARGYLQINHNEMRRLVKSGEIPSHRRGRITFVHTTDLDDWMRGLPSGADERAVALREGGAR